MVLLLDTTRHNKTHILHVTVADKTRHDIEFNNITLTIYDN